MVEYLENLQMNEGDREMYKSISERVYGGGLGGDFSDFFRQPFGRRFDAYFESSWRLWHWGHGDGGGRVR
jgi:hypothetical protein